MATVYLALGSNMGQRARHIMQGYIEINELPGTKVKRVSQIIETPPAGGPPEQEDYLNGACVIETELSPHELLENLLSIEEKHGRVRTEKWGPRPLDIDIIFCDDAVIRTEKLTVPHPHMHERLFVLKPLSSLAPDFIHPVLKKTLARLTEEIERETEF